VASFFPVIGRTVGASIQMFVLKSQVFNVTRVDANGKPVPALTEFGRARAASFDNLNGHCEKRHLYLLLKASLRRRLCPVEHFHNSNPA